MFESAIMNRQVDQLLSMFTPPTTTSEIEAYNSMMGLDDAVAMPRLFNNVSSNFKIDSWEITNINQESPDLIKVTLNEQKRGWSPVIGGYGETTSSVMIIELTNSSSQLMIDKYYWNNSPGTISKYEGLGF